MNTEQNRYTVTRESAIVVMDGRLTTVKSGSPNFNALRQALIAENWSAVRDHLRADTSLVRWAKGHFSVVDGRVLFDGRAIPSDLNNRIFQMAAADENPEALFNFWERLQKNPSNRSVEQLWRFLNQIGIPLMADGCFLAYKGVRDDFKDVHSGTIENRPGAVIQMPRNQISDDPNTPCHVGLHVGAIEYATSFGPRTVICKVDPAHVVCVPNDHSSQKMRVERYEVIGLHGGAPMPSTTIDELDLPEPSEQYDGQTQAAPVAKNRPKKWTKLDALDKFELMEQTLDTLRTYASKGLKMVGVWRTAGGKLGLIEAIIKARG